MINERSVKDVSGTIDLVEHYSSDGYKLRQVETNRVYGASVIDAIPCRFTYEETDEKDDGYDGEVSAEEMKSDLEAML